MDYSKPYESQTILVTGGAGAIGSNLSRALAEAGAARVIILDDLQNNPERCYKKILKMLNIDADFSPNYSMFIFH